MNNHCDTKAAMPATATPFKCYQCGADRVNDDDDSCDESAFVDNEGHEYCDRCWQRLFQFLCPICEQYVDKEESCPENTFFYLGEEHGALKPGYYRVTGFPVYTSDMFDVDIEADNVEKVGENLCFKSRQPLEETNFICRDCFEKGTGAAS